MSQMPTPTRATPKPAVNHPAVAEYVSQWNSMAVALDHVRAERDKLANDLEVERRANAELQHTVDGERAMKERFQRYALALNHYVSTLHSIAAQALDESQRAAVNEQPPKIIEPPNVEDIEAGVAEIAAKFAPRPEPQ